MPKALNLQPRTAEILDLRGMLGRTEDRSFATVADGHFAVLPVSYTGWDTRHPYQLGIPQRRQPSWTPHETERRDVAKQVLDSVAAQNALIPQPLNQLVLRALFRNLTALPEVQHYLSGLVSGLNIKYAAPEGTHPAQGARLPDFPVGEGFASDRFHKGKFVLLTKPHRNLHIRRSRWQRSPNCLGRTWKRSWSGQTATWPRQQDRQKAGSRPRTHGPTTPKPQS